MDERYNTIAEQQTMSVLASMRHHAQDHTGTLPCDDCCEWAIIEYRLVMMESHFAA